jgi:hypothetical protein
MTLRTITFLPQRSPQWRFWRGAVVGFLSGCVLSYALLSNPRHERVHHIEQAPESVIVAAAQRVADDAEVYLDVWLSWIRIETA